VTIALAVQSAFSKTVPGANDNASGVAGLLELGHRLAADPIDGLEVILLSPGGEEAGGVGIAGWLKQEGRSSIRQPPCSSDSTQSVLASLSSRSGKA
jgi:hypothetical protein